MKRYLKYAAIPLSLMLVIIAIGAGCRTHSHARAEERMDHYLAWASEMITDKLDLDSNQQQVLAQIKKEILARKEEIRSLHSGFADQIVLEVRNETFNQENVNALFEEREAKFKGLRKFMVTQFALFHQSLRPEQKKKLYEMVEKIKDYQR